MNVLIFPAVALIASLGRAGTGGSSGIPFEMPVLTSPVFPARTFNVAELGGDSPPARDEIS